HCGLEFHSALYLLGVSKMPGLTDFFGQDFAGARNGCLEGLDYRLPKVAEFFAPRCRCAKDQADFTLGNNIFPKCCEAESIVGVLRRNRRFWQESRAKSAQNQLDNRGQ